MKIFDLANMLRKHWNWAGDSYKPLRFDAMLPESIVIYPKHGFTHVDAPCHMIHRGKTTDDCDLSQLCGEAIIVDVSDCVPGKPITAALLESRGNAIRVGDILILRSNLNLSSPNTTNEYWFNSPFVDESAAHWIVKRGCAALVVDFPQDYVAREMGDRSVPNDEWTEHLIVLGNGLMHLEHVVGLEEISQGRVFLFGWPVKIPGSDGGPARPLALSDWPQGRAEVFDLSIGIDAGWRNTVRVMRSKSFESGDAVQETGFTWLGHSHTHVVTPGFVTGVKEDGLSALELDGMSAVCNWANRVNLPDLGPFGIIDKAMLSAGAVSCPTSEILVLCTGHAERVAYSSSDWLTRSPQLSSSAAEWVVEQGYKSVGLDFDLDAPGRARNSGLLTEAEIPIEVLLLRNGITLIKNLTGITKVSDDRFFLSAAPLRLPRADSAPARAMAVCWNTSSSVDGLF
jgi:kynurenine formamidase